MQYEFPTVQLANVAKDVILGQDRNFQTKTSGACKDAPGTTSHGAYEIDE